MRMSHFIDFFLRIGIWNQLTYDKKFPQTYQAPTKGLDGAGQIQKNGMNERKNKWTNERTNEVKILERRNSRIRAEPRRPWPEELEEQAIQRQKLNRGLGWTSFWRRLHTDHQTLQRLRLCGVKWSLLRNVQMEDSSDPQLMDQLMYNFLFSDGPLQLLPVDRHN